MTFDWFLQGIISAFIAWVVPKILDGVLTRAGSEGNGRGELEKDFPWVRWCIAHSIGGGVGGFLSGALGVVGLATPGGIGNWAIFGIAIGISQWLVLRRHLHLGPFWAVSSAVGWSIWSTFQAAHAPGPFGWSAVGLSVGILQWLILRRSRNRAVWWIPANLIGWLVAGTLGWALGMSLLEARVSPPVAWVLGWAFVGLAASLVLGWGLRRTSAKSSGAAT